MFGLLLTLVFPGSALAGVPTAATLAGVTWLVSTWPASVAFQVSRPTIALTVIVPGSHPPAITGTVTAGPASAPAVLLQSHPIPGATALVFGEETIVLGGAGRASITLTSAGQTVASQSFSFKVAPRAPLAAAPPSAATAAFIAELNAFRAQVGAAPVAVSPALTAAAAAHAAFVSAQAARYGSSVSVHDEPAALSAQPGWTGVYARDRDLAFGAVSGGGVEVMSSGNPDPVAFLVEETVFHRNLLLDPGALEAGAAEVGGQFVLDLSNWGGSRDVAATVWPQDGATAVPLTFGGEWPSPLQPFAGTSFPAGTPVTWEDAAASDGTRILNPTFTLAAAPGGQPVAGVVLTPDLWQPFTGSGVFLGTGLAFIPTHPLAAHTLYTATVAVQEFPPAGGGPVQVRRSWTFTTGDGAVLAPGGVAQAASTPAAVTVPADPWSVLPAAVQSRLAGIAQARGPAPTYSDVYLAPWAAPAIAALGTAGVLHGIGGSMFDPQDPITMGQLAAALTAFMPSQATATLANATSLPSWAVGPAETAAGAGWLDAPKGVFAAGAWATRSIAIEALTRMLGWSDVASAYAAAGGGWPPAIHGDPGQSGEAEADLMWAAHVGLLAGVDGQAAGNMALSRAQLAVLLWRVAQQGGR